MGTSSFSRSSCESPMFSPALERRSARTMSAELTPFSADLSPMDCSAMERHLVGCPVCGAAADALKRALLACQRVRTEEVPPAVQARVKAAVRAWSARIEV